jgi:hypothetical protein
MALAIATVVDSISKLSVSGLTIKDMDEIAGAVDPRAPTLFPMADFITNVQFARNSFGGGSIAKMTLSYTLNYRLCYKPVAAGRSIEYFDNMVAMCGLVLDAIMAIDTLTGCVDTVISNVQNMGIVMDPSDNQFYGCDMSFIVTEFVN